MALVKIKFSPGLLANSTMYSRLTRWVDSNLVRWRNNGIKVIGGWEQLLDAFFAPVGALYSDASTEAPRGIAVWSDNVGNNHIVVGSNLALYHISKTGVKTNITPSGFSTKPRNSSVAAGYGVGPYGGQAYGTPRTGPNLAVVPVTTWRLDNWGQDILALSRRNGPIYAWSPDSSGVAVAIPNCPNNFQDFIVTNERIVMGIGGAEARLVTWSDSENREQWVPSITNQAGSKFISGTGNLLAIRNINTQILILGQNDAHVAQYIGPPFIYDIKEAGDGCGVISSSAVVTIDKFAMWPSSNSFWLFDGSITPLDSEVVDFFYKDINTNAASKTFGYALAEFTEAVWLYQSVDSTTDEPDKYISYNYVNKTWAKGTIKRVVAHDKTVSKYPIMVSADGIIFNHEIESKTVSDVPTPYVETGPIELGTGDNMLHCDFLFPDFETENATVVVYSRDMPKKPEYASAPKTITSPTPLRARGRTLRFRFSGASSGFEVGDMRINLKSGAKR